jgi:hypothetical protein
MSLDLVYVHHLKQSFTCVNLLPYLPVHDVVDMALRHKLIDTIHLTQQSWSMSIFENVNCVSGRCQTRAETQPAFVCVKEAKIAERPGVPFPKPLGHPVPAPQ